MVHVIYVGVSLLIAWSLGRRESGVVAIAIPMTLALTLATFYFLGFTLNRITLFALIFSLGLLVDDAIVVIENIHRHFAMKTESKADAGSAYARAAPSSTSILRPSAMSASFWRSRCEPKK